MKDSLAGERFEVSFFKRAERPSANECDKRRGKGEREERGKCGGVEGRGTDGLEVTGSDRGCLTTVAHTSSLLKPDKGPTCNAERESERKRERQGQIETKKERERKQEAARFLFGKAGGSTD